MNDLNKILEMQLIESMGCTEPSAIALAVAYAKEQINLDEKICKIELSLSSNVLKNALSVTIPNTKHSGIKMIVGLALNKCESKNYLSILSGIKEDDIERASDILNEIEVAVKSIKESNSLFIAAELHTRNHVIKTIVENDHNEIKYLEKDNVVILDKRTKDGVNEQISNLNYEEVLDFIESEKINFELMRKIKNCNLEIANYGINNNVGLSVGKTMNATNLIDKKYRSLIAKTVAGIDSRMAGVSKKVYINSGSGNQGITATVPIVEMAKILKISEMEELKALALSHLTAIYIREKQGKLSSCCGAICASAGVAGAIAFMLKANKEQIKGSILNLLCSNFGVFCDGAKSTCALKVSSAIMSALNNAFLAKQNVFINSNLGILSDSLEKSLDSLAIIENKFTKSMDETILNVAIENVLNSRGDEMDESHRLS